MNGNSLFEIELVSPAKDIELHVMDRYGFGGLAVGQIRVRDGLPIDHIHRAIAHHVELASLAGDDGRVFVDADTEEPRILRDRSQKAAEPSALRKVLVHDQRLSQTQTGSHAKR